MGDRGAVARAILWHLDGQAAVQEWFGILARNVEYEAFEVKWFHAYGHKVVVLVHEAGTCRRNGERFDDELVQINTYRDGKTAHFESYVDPASAAKAAEIYSSQ